MADVVNVLGAMADAIAHSLNTRTYIDNQGVVRSFTKQFNAVKVYETDWKRDEPGLKVVVMPVAQSHEVIGRNNATQDTIRIQVGVQDEARPDETTKIDDLLQLVEEIKSHVKSARIPYLEEQNITLIGIEHSPIWDSEHLNQQNQFKTAPTFVFREAGRL